MPRDLLGDGRYNIKVKVEGSMGETVVVVAATGSSSRALDSQSSGQHLSSQTEPVENFQRITSAGEFRLRGFPPLESLKDEMPPSRIRDFRVVSFDLVTTVARLQWTSVGGDMERGSAFKYFIHLSNNFDQLLTDFKSTSPLPTEQIIRGTLDSPKASGNVEELFVYFNTTALTGNMTLFMNIHATDEAGNLGEASNIISISLAHDTAVHRQPLTTALSGMTYLAICLPLTLFALVTIILIVSVMVVRARKTKSEDFEQAEECTTHSVHSLDIEYMNYTFDGEYRKRQPEEIDTWSRGSI
ncbi:hypothetical protein Btru_054978 [Bulinus truncatus]|nr:hypothetical protein Btru_054978 [Bulinus truncatus]